MSYKIELILDLTFESKEDADKLAHHLIADLENAAEMHYPVQYAKARRNTREEFVLNLPDSEFEPGVTLEMLEER